MDRDGLHNLLKTLGLPVAYYEFKQTPTIPYITFLFDSSSNFGADCKVYKKIDNFKVELYTEKKDPNTELLVENLFDNNDIFYDKTETYIDEEGLFQILYEIQL